MAAALDHQSLFFIRHSKRSNFHGHFFKLRHFEYMTACRSLELIIWAGNSGHPGYYGDKPTVVAEFGLDAGLPPYCGEILTDAPGQACIR